MQGVDTTYWYKQKTSHIKTRIFFNGLHDFEEIHRHTIQNPVLFNTSIRC